MLYFLQFLKCATDYFTRAKWRKSSVRSTIRKPNRYSASPGQMLYVHNAGPGFSWGSIRVLSVDRFFEQMAISVTGVSINSSLIVWANRWPVRAFSTLHKTHSNAPLLSRHNHYSTLKLALVRQKLPSI